MFSFSGEAVLEMRKQCLLEEGKVNGRYAVGKCVRSSKANVEVVSTVLEDSLIEGRSRNRLGKQ